MKDSFDEKYKVECTNTKGSVDEDIIGEAVMLILICL